MPRPNRMTLDKVERKFLLKLKEITPEYALLDLDQIAHLELKEHLLKKARETFKNKNKNPLLDAPVV